MKKDKKPNLLKRIFSTKRRIIILLILIIAGVLSYKFFTSRNSTAVKTSRVYQGKVSEELILSGEIKAEEQANLNFLYSGELDYVGVVEGQTVKKGDILAKLDSTNAYQTFLQVDADLRRYTSSLDKTYDDVQGHEADESFADRESRTVAETNKDKAYRTYVIAQKNLANLNLKAPFDGIITGITHPFNGINTSLAESQIEIVNPTTLFFSVDADQTDVTNIKLGQKVAIILDSFGNEELEGVVLYISYTPKAGEIGTVYEVKVRFANIDAQKIRIGMSGDAKFILSEKENVLFVPPEFVKTDTTGKYVNLTKKNNKKYIEVGIESEDKVEIKGDINEGDIVYD